MANVQSGYHNFSFSVCPRTNHTLFLKLKILYVIFFPENSSHSDCHRSNIYLFARDFKSENGISSTEVSPTRASLAAASAAELPLMPTWPGTQTKTISFASLVKSIYSSRIWTKTGCSYFRLNIAFSDENESDSIKNDYESDSIKNDFL